MPIFDYRCSECGKTYDVYHKVREIVEDVVCPSCSSAQHKKLMSAPSIAIAGSSSTDFSSSASCESSGGCCGGACSVN
ncbi:MAG: zinc ribbon domain-containing protein [Ignavibacteriales bacterium]|nr:zinc ribbon domain-containing protein [Ignavibacteriales bacterium]